MLAMAILAGLAVGAKTKIELLGQPCRSKNVLGGRVVVDRKDGRERLALTNMNEDTGAEMIFIDWEKDTAKIIKAPAGAGAWAINEVPGDRLIVGTFYDGQFMVFDLKTMRFIKHVGVPGETYIWNLAMGGDGRIYGGTYGGGKLLALDLNTYAAEDLGAPAPPNLYLRYVSPMPDGRVLCSFISEKPQSLIFDPATKKFEPVPKQLEGVSMAAVWQGYLVAGSATYDGKTLARLDAAQFPTPRADWGAWSVDPYITDNDTLYLQQGHALWRHRRGEKDLTLVTGVGLRGGRLYGGSKDGSVLGVRGQDYFVIRPGDKDLKLRPIPGESGPRPTLFLKVDEKGRVWGGPHFGQTLFYIDPRTKKTVNTSTVCDAGGEVYDVAFYQGKTFCVSYAGGNIIAYDPEQPWDQWGNKNPKTIAALTTSGYIRPTGGMLLGPDRKLYSGWQARYGEYGGAIAITNPRTEKTELIENPLGEMAIEGLAVDDKYAYLGTNLEGNGLPKQTGVSPKFGMLDLKTRQVVFEKSFDGFMRVNGIVWDARTRLVAMVVGGHIRVFDPSRREFIENPALEAAQVTSSCLSAPGDGKVYFGSAEALCTLDLKSMRVENIAKAPSKIGRLAIGPDGAAYFTCGVDLYRVVK